MSVSITQEKDTARSMSTDNPLHIESIEVILVDMPTIRSHHLSFATVTTQNHALVRIHAEGITGYGEASTVGGAFWGGESTESIKTIIDNNLAPALVGQDANALALLCARMDQTVFGNPFAKAAIETALHDLVARSRNLPLHALLGGKTRDSFYCVWPLASGDTGKDTEEALEMLRIRRHRHFKLKVGAKEPAQDFAHVAAICKAVGDQASIRIDVNQGWDLLTAQQWLPRLQDVGVDLVEQPIARWNVQGAKKLTASLQMAVMADEGVFTPQEAATVSSEGAANVVALKLTKHGGIRNTLKVAAIAETYGLDLYGGAMLETAVGTATQLHTYSTLTRTRPECECMGPLIHKDQLTLNQIEYRDFQVWLPSGAGNGVSVDEEKLARYRRR